MLAAVMLIAALPAQAKTWITLSSWAYTDVSNYRKDGLLPSSMEEISDYTTEINRLQFAEVLYNSMLKSKLARSDYGYYNGFEDIKSVAATYLRNMGIVEGEVVATDDYGNNKYNFYPDRKLTREEMAVMLYRTVTRYASGLLQADRVVPADDDKVSEWAKESVGSLMGSGIMLGRDGGKFDPQGTLTIEQTIVSVYRLYQMYPTAPNADGAGLRTNTETFIQSYENGMSETIKGNMLYIKQGDNVLMDFETDVYSCIDAVTVNGKNYAVAQHCNKKTDVYDMETKKILFSIPYPYSYADSKYIVTENSDIGPMTFGLYDYSGKEILEPKYSGEELEKLKVNNFVMPKEAYRAPDGWYYYADWHDEGHLYKIDTNGENKQKLSDYDCFNIVYINGWLFYSARGEYENKLFCVRADGKYEQQLTKNNGRLLVNSDAVLELVESDGKPFEVWFASDRSSNYENYVFDGEWIYYGEADEDKGENVEKGAIYRVRFEEDGTAVKEKVSGDVPMYTSVYGGGNAIMRDSTLYFRSEKTWVTREETGESIYAYKDGELTKISGDYEVSNFGFTDDGRLAFSVIENSEEQFEDDYRYTISMEIYVESEKDGEFVIYEEAEPYIKAKLESEKKSHDEWVEKYKNGTEDEDNQGNWVDMGEGEDEDLPEEQVLEDVSDERHTVFYKYKWEKTEHSGYGGAPANLCVRDADGNVTVLCENDEWVGNGMERRGDILYYTQKTSNNGHTAKAFIAYDLNSGEKKTIADDVSSLSGDSSEKDTWLFYTDTNLNTNRYDIESGKITQLYPNSSSNRYGKLYYLTKMYNGEEGVYKVDTDGNISTLTDTLAMYGVYVPDGAKTGNDGSYYDLVYSKERDVITGKRISY